MKSADFAKDEPQLTGHAARRATGRRIPVAGIEAAVRFGRRWRENKAWYYRLDRRSLKRARRRGEDLSRHEGITVVMGDEGRVITVWRNRTGRKVYR